MQATREKKISWDKTSRNSEFKSVIGISMVTTDRWDGIHGIGYLKVDETIADILDRLVSN